MKATVLMRQTLSDIALEIYGDISGLPVIARANGLSMTADAYLQNYVRTYGIKPATAYSDTDGEIRQRIFTEQFTLEFQ